MDGDHGQRATAIYLGAAPGVGKTFAMLNEAHRRLDRGTDVVVGLVEVHGRAKTAAALAGLEVVPRRSAEYRGAMFTELDVDAVQARRPQVALIDELAHTNVPGSRNEKRWQDIDELLDAGIEVISTLNIQHLESLNDVVTKITGVVQRETVPTFVPPAHGLVFMAGLSLSEALRRHSRALVAVAAAAATVWGVLGLTVLPRLDAAGAIGVPPLLAFLWRSRARAAYAGVFLVVGALELYGTAIGTWHWAETLPGLGIPDGNPPSGVASGYVWFDVMALLLAPRLLLAAQRTWPLRRRPVPGTGRV